MAIDSQISAINTMAHPERFEAYKEGVRKMLVQVLDAKSTDPFSGIRGLVVTNAQVDIGDAGLSSVKKKKKKSTAPLFIIFLGG